MYPTRPNVSMRVLVCVCLSWGGGRMHTYYSFQDRQFQGNYAHSTEFLPLPNHLHHQSPTHPLSITAHHSPSPPPSLSAGFCLLYSLYMILYTHRLYAKSDLVTYTSIHVYVSVYNTLDKLTQQGKYILAIFASKLPF